MSTSTDGIGRLKLISQYSYGLNQRASKNNNVIEIYKKWNADEVRADLNPKRSKLVNICQNLSGDFNIATIIRSNNAFLGSATYIVGRKKYDSRGCCGTNHYEHVYHADDFKEVVDKLHDEGYTVFAVDNWPQYHPKNLFDIKLPEKSAFCFGEERLGLSEDTISLCDDMVYINQVGSVRSLNVGCAASIIMYEYSKQHKL